MTRITHPRPSGLELLPEREKGVYVLALANGVVKIGYSTNCRSRIRMLCGEVVRKYATQVTRFYVKGGSVNSRRIESSVLRRIGRIAQRPYDDSEFFTGIDFDSVVRVVREEAAHG